MTTFTIKQSKITGEYIVEVRQDGIRNESRDYFTDDFEDAKDTCRCMCDEARKRGEEVP